MDCFKVIGITGAEGFIGKNLARFLSEKHHLILFGEGKNYELKNSSWINKNLFLSSREDYEGLDLLIHLAGTPFSKDALRKNFELTKHVLDKSMDGGVKNFVFASSYAVYGPRKNPATEKSKLNPFEDYSKSKVLCEDYIKKKSKNKINYKILRICSIYGEGGRGLINIIKRKISEEEVINFDSVFERQYLHIEDFCKEIFNILNEEEKDKIYNIEGERLSTKDLHLLLAQKNINSNLIQKDRENFLCKGKNKFSHKVEDFIFS